MKRIQLVSDIHLERWGCGFPKVTSVAPILCLAGDIGWPNMSNYRDFLKDVHGKFQKIFMVAGNHEYYGQEKMVEEVNCDIVDILERNNLYKISFLDNQSEMWDDLLFVGSTMWSKIDDADGKLVQDFRMIRGMDVGRYNRLHGESVAFLRGQIERNGDKNLVVMTHHLPAYELIGRQYERYRAYNQCFASHNADLIRPPIRAWLFGHSHCAHRSVMNGVQLASNPIGYPNENKDASYCEKVDFIILK